MTILKKVSKVSKDHIIYLNEPGFEKNMNSVERFFFPIQIQYTQLKIHHK